MDSEIRVSHENVLWYIYRDLAEEMFSINDDKKHFIRSKDLCYNKKIKKIKKNKN